LLVALLVGVFWFSSGTKRFLFNRLLAQSGLDRSLQYAIAQVVSNIVLVVGIVIDLENTGIHLAALAVFAGAVGVGVGFGLQNIASNFISGLVILAERPITVGDRVEVAGIAGQVQHIRVPRPSSGMGDTVLARYSSRRVYRGTPISGVNRPPWKRKEVGWLTNRCRLRLEYNWSSGWIAGGRFWIHPLVFCSRCLETGNRSSRDPRVDFGFPRDGPAICQLAEHTFSRRHRGGRYLHVD